MYQGIYLIYVFHDRCGLKNLDSPSAQSENACCKCKSGTEDLYGTTGPECRNDC